MSQYTQRQRRYSSNGRSKFTNKKRGGSRGFRKSYIDPSKFVRAARPQKTEEKVELHYFNEFNLHPAIARNLEIAGFKHPSPIQYQSIPHSLQGKDIVGIANTGTGKTAAFAIPVINRLLDSPSKSAIILAPTRELAQQIEDQFRKLVQGTNLRTAILIGGVSMGPQFKQLSHKPRIIIGTPGRIKDHYERKSLHLSNINIVVLDEVDRMLDMGFVDDIRDILSLTQPDKQSLYFSATLDNRVKDIIGGFSKDPVHISIKSNETSDNIDQNIVQFSSASDKMNKLHEILVQDNQMKTLVFDDTHRSVDDITKELVARGFIADSIHGGKSQAKRQRVLKNFKNNSIQVLVATDVAARGIDVSDITHVINYSLPQDYESYVHRIGRTGRAGKVGYALTFVNR